MAGKVRQAIDLCNKNIAAAQKAISNAKWEEAKKQWGLAQASYQGFEQAVKTMSGKTKTINKAKKIEAFRTQYALVANLMKSLNDI